MLHMTGYLDGLEMTRATSRVISSHPKVKKDLRGCDIGDGGGTESSRGAAREFSSGRKPGVRVLYLHSAEGAKDSWEVARQLLIHSPHCDFPLCGVRRQLLILLEFHRGDRLIFGRSFRNLILDSVSSVN